LPVRKPRDPSVVIDVSSVEAVAFDFFDTLAFHRDGRGRGRVLYEYLEAHGLSPGPWEHQALYDVFESHDVEYSPAASVRAHEQYRYRIASRVFDRLTVAASEADVARHATALWNILGPRCFAIFPDALEALHTLRAEGIPLVVISNWQSGLRHYCHDLGIADFFDHIIASADFGAEKPDARIFHEGAARLGVRPDQLLHVGDSYDADYLGGEAAGLQVVLVARKTSAAPNVRAVSNLMDLVKFISG